MVKSTLFGLLFRQASHVELKVSPCQLTIHVMHVFSYQGFAHVTEKTTVENTIHKDLFELKQFSSISI